MDEYRDERHRIDQETRVLERELVQENASLSETREIVDMAIRILDEIPQAYTRTKPEARREFNQGFFEHVIVGEHHVTEARLCEPFRTLLTDPVKMAGIQWT